jgi:hypothetical protein
MGFTPRLPRGLFHGLVDSHPRLRAAAAHLEGLGIPRDRAAALLRSLMISVTEDLGGQWLSDMTARLRRIEDIRGRVSSAVEHVLDNGALPPGMDHAAFSRLFGELQREMDELSSVQRHAEGLDRAAVADRVLAPATPTPGRVAPHPPESLAAAMDQARLANPRGAAIIDRAVASPDHGDLLGLALAAETESGQATRLRELSDALGLSPEERADLAASVGKMSLARAQLQRVDPAAVARRQRAASGLPAELAERVMGDNFVLGPMAETNRPQLLALWRQWRASGAAQPFGDYVRGEMNSMVRPMVSENQAAFVLGAAPGTAVLKDAAAFDPSLPGGRRVNPREPGTDLLLMRDNGDLWYVDDKAHRGGKARDPVSLSGVSAFEGQRFVTNIRDDIAELEAGMTRQRSAGDVPDPRMGDAIARLRSAADELDGLMAGKSIDDMLHPENLRAMRSILDRHRIRLRVTSEWGDVTSMTSRLQGLGIRVEPPFRPGAKP